MSKHVYLAGTMSGLKDRGCGWRKKIQTWLESCGEGVFSPPDREEALFKKYGFNPSMLQEGNKKVSGSLKAEMFADVLDYDLDQLERSSYAIFYLTQCSWGTAGELTYALRRRIPTYIVTNLRLTSFAAARPKKMEVRTFTNFDQLKNFLRVRYKLKPKTK